MNIITNLNKFKGKDNIAIMLMIENLISTHFESDEDFRLVIQVERIKRFGDYK